MRIPIANQTATPIQLRKPNITFLHDLQ